MGPAPRHVGDRDPDEAADWLLTWPSHWLLSAAVRLHSFLERYRFALLAGAIVHCVLLHYFWIGIATWDGFGHRLPPIVELVKHGRYNLDKYDNWALIGFHPFVELINAPFLALFGLDGIYFAAAAFMPLAAVAVYAFVKELTEDARTALYATIAYFLVPVVNAQLFSGYVDWSIPGLLSFFLWSLLRATKEPTKKRLALVVLSTFLFTMARQQALYLAVFFFVLVVALKCVVFENKRPRLTSTKIPAVVALAMLVGMVPEARIQVGNFIEHGTPIYPYQFALLGIKTRVGTSWADLAKYAGVKEYSLAGFLRAFVSGWIWSEEWPHSFYDSRDLGGGFFFALAVLTLPLSLKRANRQTKVFLASFVFLAIVGRDYFLPRYSYSLVIVTTTCVALALTQLLEQPRRQWLYYALFSVLALHVLRPEWDIWRIEERDAYPRLNANRSATFIPGVFDVELYPDVNAKLVVVHWPANGFSLPFYGRRLTNTVLGSIPPEKLGDHCEGLSAFRSQAPDFAVIDVEDSTKKCARTCAIPGRSSCLAWKVEAE